jgi:hypothetical protein
MSKSQTEKLFTVFNQTDGIPVSHGPVSEKRADEIIRTFPDRFKHQGYYLTGRRERIDPKDVVLVKHEYEENIEEDGYDCQHGPF